MAGVLWALGLACGGPGAGPADPAPAPLPAGWDARVVPAGEILGAADLRCAGGAREVVWHQDGSFLVTGADAKFGGSWRLVDGTLAHVTTGPMGPCTAARFLLGAGGEPHALVCAEGPIGCAAGDLRWAVEVLDAGGGPEATEAVGRTVAALDPSFGRGVVLRGDARRARTGVAVRYRAEDGTARRLAEQIGLALEPRFGAVQVRPDPEAASPAVVVVGAAGP